MLKRPPQRGAGLAGNTTLAWRRRALRAPAVTTEKAGCCSGPHCVACVLAAPSLRDAGGGAVTECLNSQQVYNGIY